MESANQSWQTANVIETANNTCSYTYQGLKEGILYKLRVLAYDKAGNSYESELKEATTLDSSAPESVKMRINGVKGTDEWYKGKVMVNITPGKDTGAGIKGFAYKVEKIDSEEIKVTEPPNLGNVVKYKEGTKEYHPETLVNTTGTSSVEIKENGKYIITAWTIDKVGHKSPAYSEMVKIDMSEGKTGEIKAEHVGAKMAEVTVTGVDKDTGIAAYYFDYQKQGSTSWATQYIAKTSERSYNYNYTNLLENTNYNLRVRILDKAGNMSNPGETEWLKIKTQEKNMLPTIEEEDIRVKEETLNGLVFGIKASDRNKDKLTYKLYKEVTVNDETHKQVVATATGNSGEEVTFVITGLESGQSYSWNLMISDGIGTIYSEKSVRGQTLCTGVGNNWCEGPFYKTCQACNGKGYYMVGGTRVECSPTQAAPCQHGYYSRHRTCIHNQVIIHSQSVSEDGIVSTSTCSGPNTNNKVICTNCFGKGKFLTGNDETECNTCKGTGKISEKTCRHGETGTHKYALIPEPQN